MRKWMLIPALILSLSACCSTVEPVKLPIPAPLMPNIDYPTISHTELECLSDSAYKRLVTRERVFKARISTLRSILESTQ